MTVLRISAIALAAGFWFMIGMQFLAAGVATTAPANYLLLSLLCMGGGVWLGWKK